MLKYKTTTRTVTDEIGRNRVFHYEITSEEIPAGEFFCKSYGVKVTDEDGETACMEGITTSFALIDALLTLLTDCLVGPTTLRDVVEDWMYAARR